MAAKPHIAPQCDRFNDSMFSNLKRKFQTLMRLVGVPPPPVRKYYNTNSLRGAQWAATPLKGDSPNLCFNVLSGVLRPAEQGFGLRREVIITYINFDLKVKFK